ncbi:MAG: triose-phosphate isomerase [Zetaproteobacteria bacterium]|nr:triose-phosphate isomerase [Zetaproteobacteria bacterium]
MTARCLIAGNWKMNGTLAEALSFADGLTALSNDGSSGVEVALMPPYTLLHSLRSVLADKGVQLGAQNVYTECNGAYTGSISTAMLKDAGCKYVILGHSERRNTIGEGNALIRRKLDAVWAEGLVPILCIGELLEERESNHTNDVLKAQLSILTAADADKPLVVAYEPVWAIGTGKTATPEQVVETHAFVHEVLVDLGADRQVLYGGSVNGSNAQQLLHSAGVDGALVGGASLQAASFMQIIEAAK